MTEEANTPEYRPWVDPDRVRPFPAEQEAKAWPDGFTIRDEANALVAFAFRNGPIENLHAGEYSELLENKALSRITDPEMKEIMIDACERLSELLRMKETHPEAYDAFVKDYNVKYCWQWARTDRPKPPRQFPLPPLDLTA